MDAIYFQHSMFYLILLTWLLGDGSSGQPFAQSRSKFIATQWTAKRSREQAKRHAMTQIIQPAHPPPMITLFLNCNTILNGIPDRKFSLLADITHLMQQGMKMALAFHLILWKKRLILVHCSFCAVGWVHHKKKLSINSLFKRLMSKTYSLHPRPYESNWKKIQDSRCKGWDSRLHPGQWLLDKLTMPQIVSLGKIFIEE